MDYFSYLNDNSILEVFYNKLQWENINNYNISKMKVAELRELFIRIWKLKQLKNQLNQKNN